MGCRFRRWKANLFFFSKSLSPGYAGIDNDLFYRDNIFICRCKKMTEEIVKSL